MSAGAKQSREFVLANVVRFRALFNGTFESWTVAGSLRRGLARVGDVEHVIVPKIVPIVEESFFGSKTTGHINRVWEATESLVRTKLATKAEYGETKSHRWGELYRGLVFEGVRHELFTADSLNLGSVLAIRTGPAEFSERLVTLLKQGGRYRQHLGYVRRVHEGHPIMADDAIVPVPDEATYFKLCGVPFTIPEQRDRAP